MFSTKKFIYELDEKGKFRLRKYVLVQSGISWTDAKIARKKDPDLQIVKDPVERSV